MKIPKYNNNTLANKSIDRNSIARTNIQIHHRKTHRFFFKPYIDINEVIGTKSTIKEWSIYVWTIKIQNTDNTITKKLKLSKNATDCYCQIDIRRNTKSIASGELAIIDNLPKIEVDNNEHIENSIKKYCDTLHKNVKMDTKITRNSFKELLFLITVKDSDFMYFLEKQNIPVLDEYYSTNLNYRMDLIPIKLDLGKYDINLVFNCKEKKDERGRNYLLTASSWNDVKLVET